MAYCRCFFFSSRRRHTRSLCDWSSDVCSSDLSTFHYELHALQLVYIFQRVAADGYDVRPFPRFDDSQLVRSEEHTSELQSHSDLVCRLLLEKKKKQKK